MVDKPFHSFWLWIKINRGPINKQQLIFSFGKMYYWSAIDYSVLFSLSAHDIYMFYFKSIVWPYKEERWSEENKWEEKRQEGERDINRRESQRATRETHIHVDSISPFMHTQRWRGKLWTKGKHTVSPSAHKF